MWDSRGVLAGVLAAQGALTALGLSVILGRMYVEAYRYALGIQRWPLEVDIVEYALVDPYLSVLIVLCCVVIPLALLAMLSVDRSNSRSGGWLTTGILFLVVPVLLWSYRFLIYGNLFEGLMQEHELTFVSVLLVIFLCPVGAFLLLRNLPSRSGSRFPVTSVLRRCEFWGVPVAVVLVVSTFMALSSLAEGGGVLAAERALDGPVARVEMASDFRDVLCGEGNEGCLFRVLLIEDSFIYLSPVADGEKREVVAVRRDAVGVFEFTKD